MMCNETQVNWTSLSKILEANRQKDNDKKRERLLRNQKQI